MGKLNENIRCIVSTGNTCFTVTGLLLGGLTGYLLYAIAPATFTFGSLYQGWISSTMLVGVALLLVSCTGCLGLKRQVVRVGPCGGRKLLSLYQLLVLGLMVAFGAALLAMRALHAAVPLLLENPESPYALPEQKMLAPFFDRVYFKTKAHVEKDYDEQGGSYKWFVAWTGQNCPLSMDVGSCTFCEEDNTYNDGCCPRQDLCDAGNLDACPYKRCRLGMASFLGLRLGLLIKYMYFFLLLQLIVLLSTGLLICYNPRDSFADLLAKTGVVVTHERRAAPTPNSIQRRSGGSNRPAPREYEASPGSASSLRGRSPHATAAVVASPGSPCPVADVEGGRGSARYGGGGGAGRRSPTHMV